MRQGQPSGLYGLDILPAQRLLLQNALADWPRRSAPMLVVNCGSGDFLPFLWQAGFDIMATEEDKKLRELAAAKSVPGLDIRAAADTDLPFEDETFDWTIVHALSGNNERLEKSSREARRVSRRGFMFVFWNITSLPLLYWRLFHRTNWPMPSASWRRVWQVARKQSCGKVRTFAILPCPPGSRLPGKIKRWLNRQMSFLPLGAWCIVRVDFYPARPFTGLPLRVDSGFAKAEAGIEWAHERIAQKKQDNEQ